MFQGVSGGQRRLAACGSISLWVMCLASSAHADLQFTQPIANAGEVRSGLPLAHKFKFVNQGSEPVEITEARPSCGCLTPKLSSKVLKPGEEGTLDLEVNTLNQNPGSHNWRVLLRYKSGNMLYEFPVQLSAQVIQEIHVQPAALTVFTDAGVYHEVYLTDLRATPCAITSVKTSSASLKAHTAEEVRDPFGRLVRKVRLEVAGDFAEGRHDESLVIYTDDPTYRELKVPVTVIKRSKARVAATPNQVSLHAAVGQPIPSHVVLIRDNDNQRVFVDRVVADDPAMSCSWAQGPGPMVTLKVAVDRHKLAGNQLQTNVHVHVHGPVDETLTIPVSCSAQ